MVYTIFLAVMMMVGLFLMLWAEVSFIRDKRFASSHIPIQRLKMFWVLIFFGYNWKMHLSFIISVISKRRCSIISSLVISEGEKAL